VLRNIPLKIKKGANGPSNWSGIWTIARMPPTVDEKLLKEFDRENQFH
jgi:hypothetical protein